VNDPVSVRVGEPASHLHPDSERLRDAEGAAGQPRGQRFALEELENQVGTVLAPAQVVERHDVGMRAERRRLCLAEQEVPGHLGASARVDGLEGHGPPQVPVARLVYDAEAAAPHFPDEFEPTDHCSRPEGAFPAVPRFLLRGADQFSEECRHLAGARSLRRRRAFGVALWRHSQRLWHAMRSARRWMELPRTCPPGEGASPAG